MDQKYSKVGGPGTWAAHKGKKWTGHSPPGPIASATYVVSNCTKLDAGEGVPDQYLHAKLHGCGFKNVRPRRVINAKNYHGSLTTVVRAQNDTPKTANITDTIFDRTLTSDGVLKIGQIRRRAVSVCLSVRL